VSPSTSDGRLDSAAERFNSLLEKFGVRRPRPDAWNANPAKPSDAINYDGYIVDALNVASKVPKVPTDLAELEAMVDPATELEPEWFEDEQVAHSSASAASKYIADPSAVEYYNEDLFDLLAARDKIQPEVEEVEVITHSEHMDLTSTLALSPLSLASIANRTAAHITHALNNRRVYASVMLFIASLNLLTIMLAITYLGSRDRTRECHCEAAVPTIVVSSPDAKRPIILA
jgi:hypothetical protein